MINEGIRIRRQTPLSVLPRRDSTEKVVLARMNNCSDPRGSTPDHGLRLITHLHAAVKETEPTMEEWFDAIRFLTWAGQICTDRRQEWVLLSDVLGVSMLVDAGTSSKKPPGATQSTVLGPFHVRLWRFERFLVTTTIYLDGRGMPLAVSGRVTDTNGSPIAGATLDVWMTKNG